LIGIWLNSAHHGEVIIFSLSSNALFTFLSSHPKHPATVHFPITFTCLTGALDIFHVASKNRTTAPFVNAALKALDIAVAPGVIPHLSYYTTLLSIITSVPATATGAWELMPLIKRDGVSSRKAQTGIAHAVLNDLMFFGAIYNWWTRRQAPGFEQSTTNIAISCFFALPTTLFAAHLGASLVYNYGMGVGRKSNKAKKAQ
jgi:uncharacterized membrane protein